MRSIFSNKTGKSVGMLSVRGLPRPLEGRFPMGTPLTPNTTCLDDRLFGVGLLTPKRPETDAVIELFLLSIAAIPAST
eukprot:739092-Rhodomonas_salina.8